MKKQLNWNYIDSFNSKFTTRFTSTRRCPICNSKKKSNIQQLKKFQFFSDSALPRKIDIKNVICKHCFVVYQNPVYNNKGLKNLFNAAGMSYGSTELSKLDQINWLRKKNLLKKNTKILDVGCYDGSFLKMLPNSINKFGIDIDKKIISEAKKKNRQIKFFCQNFEKFKSKIKFDIIVMMHVLEHLNNPLDVLKNLKKVSNINSKLIIEVPILENHKTNQLDGFITVQHTTHFTENSLSNIMLKSGWKIIDKKKIQKYNGFRIICKINNELFKEDDINLNPRDHIFFRNYVKDYNNQTSIISQKFKKYVFSKYIIIYAAGLHLEMIYHVTNFFKINRRKKFIILDNDRLKIGRSWRGIKIYNPEIINFLSNINNFKFIISSYPYQNEIYSYLRKLKIKKKNIFKIYDKINRY